MTLAISQRPIQLIMSLGDAKRHLALSDDDHDSDVETLLHAAADYIRVRTKSAILPTTFKLSMYEAPVGEEQRLYYPPVTQIDAIQYRDASDTLQAANVDEFAVYGNDQYATVAPVGTARWPTVLAGRPDSFAITYRAGPITPRPQAVVAAKLLIRHWFDNPSAIVVGSISKELEYSVSSLCRTLGMAYYANCEDDQTCGGLYATTA